MYNMKY